LSEPWCRIKTHKDHEKEAALDRVNAAWDSRLGPRKTCASAKCKNMTREGLCSKHAWCETHKRLFRTCQSYKVKRNRKCVRSTTTNKD
jgi:hypothetical protein